MKNCHAWAFGVTPPFSAGYHHRRAGRLGVAWPARNGFVKMNRTCCWGLAFYLAAASALLAADKRPVIYVADRDSAQITANGATTEITGGGTGNSMAAAIKDLNRSCPQADVTLSRQSADYVLLVGDTHGFPGEKDKQAVVATADGKVVFSGGTRLLESAVKDACGAIVKDWSKRSSAQAAPPK